MLNSLDGLRFGADLVETERGLEPIPREPIPGGRAFLYDADADPELLRDLSTENPEEVASALAKLATWTAAHQTEIMGKREVSEEEEAGLQAMGYAGDD